MLNDCLLDSIENPRLLKLKEKTLPFRFNIMYVRGSSDAIRVADAVSRHPTDDEPGDIGTGSVEGAARAFATLQADNVESVSWRKVVECATVDEECVALARQIIDGFPEDKRSLPKILQPYWGMRDELYVIDMVPFKGRKMLIPSRLRPSVLEGLHAANQGVTGMLANARDRFFWPGLDAAVRLLRQQCRQCNEQAPSQAAEPPVSSPQPRVPFEQVVTDLCNLAGHLFLIYADRFSGWVEVERLRTNNFQLTKEVFLRWFRTYGVPEEVASDGGPPFNAHAYKTFLRNWDIRMRLSSAHYPQSNGRAEAAVKSVKRILLGNINSTTGDLNTDSAARAIMTHRNTPSQDTGVSPAVMLFGRPLKDHLPRLNQKLREEWETIADRREDALARRVTTVCPKRELQPLVVGDAVQIQNQTGNRPNKWNTTGIISEVLPNRQYNVITDGSRRITLRNRRFLKKIMPVCRKTFTDDDSPPHPTMNEEQSRPLIDPVASDPYIAPVESPNEGGPTSEVVTSELNPPDNSTQQTRSISPDSTSGTRRGTRERAPRKLFNARMDGKYHDY